MTTDHPPTTPPTADEELRAGVREAAHWLAQLEADSAALQRVRETVADLAAAAERLGTGDRYRMGMLEVVHALRPDLGTTPRNPVTTADPPACGAYTPNGPCALAPRHPVGPMFPGHYGHMPERSADQSSEGPRAPVGGPADPFLTPVRSGRVIRDARHGGPV